MSYRTKALAWAAAATAAVLLSAGVAAPAMAAGPANRSALSLVSVDNTQSASINRGLWSDIPGLSAVAVTENFGSLLATVSGEVITEGTVFVRVLVDNAVAQPSDVVFRLPGLSYDGVRSFTFGWSGLSAGKHVVRAQWLSSDTVHMNNRTLSVKTGTLNGADQLVQASAESDWITYNTAEWVNVPDLTASLILPGNRDVTAVFSALTKNHAGDFRARAMVDGVPTTDVLFEQSGVGGGARSYPFVMRNVGAGRHVVSIQWLADDGPILLADRAMSISFGTNNNGSGLMATESHTLAEMKDTAFTDVPGLSGTVTTTAPSTNLEMIVSAALTTTRLQALVRVTIDGTPVGNPGVELIPEATRWRAQTYTFAAKNVLPGTHTVRVQLLGTGIHDLLSSTILRDRALVVTYRPRSGPDFAQPFKELAPRVGTIPTLIICFDPRRPNVAAPTAAYLRGMHDGSDGGINVQAWFRENTGGQFGVGSPTMVGCTDGNWLAPPAGRTGTWYWDTGNFPLMWQDALKAADPLIDYRTFDLNGDHKLTGDEVAVEIVRPQNETAGFGREASARVDGIDLTVTVLDVYLSSFTDPGRRALNVGLVAHETTHAIMGTADMYWESPIRPGLYSVMDNHGGATHLDAFHKLKSGFLTPDALEITTLPAQLNTALGAVETRHEITILYDPARGDREYFILENRWAGTGDGNYDIRLPAKGIVVWHIIEDPALMNQFRPPFTGTGDPPESREWGRLGVRLMGVLTGAGQSRLLRNADGSSTGVTVTATTGSQEFMGVRLDRA